MLSTAGPGVFDGLNANYNNIQDQLGFRGSFLRAGNLGHFEDGCKFHSFYSSAENPLLRGRQLLCYGNSISIIIHHDVLRREIMFCLMW